MAAISPEVLRRSIETFKCRFSQIYGLTETTGPFTLLTHEHLADERTSCRREGDVLRATDVRRDGWLRTGDAGYVDKDGFFFIKDRSIKDRIKDRIKDMIVSGSENIYPTEAEAVLANHPDLLEVAVGVPGAKWGESVKACLVRRAGSEGLIDWCRDKLAGYKRPRTVDFLDALPCNASGKNAQAQIAGVLLDRLRKVN
jgi:acyl-CoA synthetase (AMP-forming)/AMP-acid ligase II